jgi:UDP-N-acetylmuramate dehydrogenase
VTEPPTLDPRPGERLAPWTSLKVGGPARYALVARSAGDIAAGLRWAAEQRLPARVIGGGSNLLVADAGFDGLVVRALSGGWHVEERAAGPVLAADAGVQVGALARTLARAGYGGLEWAATVPGTLGGAAVNNAGAFGGDTAGHLEAVWLIDAAGAERRLPAAELEYGYRSSRLKRRALGDVAVIRVEVRLARVEPQAARRQIDALQAQRTATQPRQQSAGSVFANPPGDYSGRLIEAAGLKGARVGGAEISPQHANFIVNVAKASAGDVYELVRLAQAEVYKRTGTWLWPEIELFGDWAEGERAALSAPPPAGAAVGARAATDG